MQHAACSNLVPCLVSGELCRDPCSGFHVSRYGPDRTAMYPLSQGFPCYLLLRCILQRPSLARLISDVRALSAAARTLLSTLRDRIAEHDLALSIFPAGSRLNGSEPIRRTPFAASNHVLPAPASRGTSSRCYGLAKLPCWPRAHTSITARVS